VIAGLASPASTGSRYRFFKGAAHRFNDFVLHPIEAVFGGLSHIGRFCWRFLPPVRWLSEAVTRHFGEIRTFIGAVRRDVAVFPASLDAMLGGLRGLTDFWGIC
jgi:hypothetical protein